tara:strand:- start:175 stop:432 length:258 start_codon:yes stop_codon:yes gene_type:complete
VAVVVVIGLVVLELVVVRVVVDPVMLVQEDLQHNQDNLVILAPMDLVILVEQEDLDLLRHMEQVEVEELVDKEKLLQELLMDMVE